MPNVLHFRGLLEAGPNEAWLAGDTVDGRGILFRSVDGMQTWRQVVIPYPASELDAVAIINGSIVVSGEDGIDGTLLTTPDKGVTWKQQALVTSSGAPARLAAIASNGAVVAVGGTDGNRPVILLSSDHANSFHRVTGLGFNGAVMALALVSSGIYAGGYEQLGSEARQGIISRSTDGGVHWQRLATPPSATVSSITSVGPSEIVAATISGGFDAILVSRDAGQAWQNSTLPGSGLIPVLERLFVGEARSKSVYAIGGASGLFRTGTW
jgi:photosystem II stability/assembly factor-like uncharacterized protein